MSYFPSEEWVTRFRDAVNDSEEYRLAAGDWEGDITFVVEPDPEAGFDQEEVHIRMHLRDGRCEEASITSEEEGSRSRFVIRAPYSMWKQTLTGEIDPIKAIMQGQLRARGDIPALTDFRHGARELVRVTSSIPTEYAGG